MLAPVIASSLTTIAAFLPLMLVGGRIGNILGAIPLVIICVILASLVESFLVLPGHLRNAFVHTHKVKPNSIRARLDRGFDAFATGCSGPSRRSPSATASPPSPRRWRC
jgi:multidrug efflux pump subunit AcrB